MWPRWMLAIAVLATVGTTSRAAPPAPPVVVLLGPPGAGKSTQAGLLAAAFGFPVISPGALLRAEVARHTPLGQRIAGALARGELVDDATVEALVSARLGAADCARGVILDGFPRTVAQARFLDGWLTVHRFAPPTVVALEVPLAVLIARLGGRGRGDDTPEVVERRMRVYEAEAAPLVAHYALGVHRVRGDRAPDEVQRDIAALLPPRAR